MRATCSIRWTLWQLFKKEPGMKVKWKYVGIGALGASATIAALFLVPEILAVSALGLLWQTISREEAKATMGSCTDGWPSQSLGKQGCCSWHQGVVGV